MAESRENKGNPNSERGQQFTKGQQSATRPITPTGTKTPPPPPPKKKS